MSTLELMERHISPFDILFRNFFNAEEQFAPALNSKQPHPVNIYHDDKGLYFEIAATGLVKKDISIDVHDGVLTIKGNGGSEVQDDKVQYLYKGIAKRSFEQKFRLEQ